MASQLGRRCRLCIFILAFWWEHLRNEKAMDTTCSAEAISDVCHYELSHSTLFQLVFGRGLKARCSHVFPTLWLLYHKLDSIWTLTWTVISPSFVESVKAKQSQIRMWLILWVQPLTLIGFSWFLQNIHTPSHWPLLMHKSTVEPNFSHGSADHLISILVVRSFQQPRLVMRMTELRFAGFLSSGHIWD